MELNSWSLGERNHSFGLEPGLSGLLATKHTQQPFPFLCSHWGWDRPGRLLPSPPHPPTPESERLHRPLPWVWRVCLCLFPWLVCPFVSLLDSNLN